MICISSVSTEYPILPQAVSLLMGIVSIIGLYFLKHIRSPERLRTERPYLLLSSIIFVSLVIPIGLGTGANILRIIIRYFVKPEAYLTVLYTLTVLLNLLYLIGICFIIYFVIKRKILSDISTIKFLLFALLIGLFLKLSYIFLIDMKAISDFGAMWKFAAEVVKHGWPGTLNLIQQERCTPYFIPLVWFFGDSAIVYELANVFSLLLCSLIAFDLGRRWFGENVGRASMILILLVPETFFNSVIPTHDIPGVLFLLISLWIVDIILQIHNKNRLIKCLLLSLFLGVLIQFMDIQRSFAFFWWVAIVLFFIFEITKINEFYLSKNIKKLHFFRQKLMLLILLLILPWIIFKGTNIFLRNKNLILNNTKKSFLIARGLGLFSDSWGTGSYLEAKKNYRAYYGKMSLNELRAFAFNKLISDIYYNSIDRITNYAAKSIRLYLLGSQRNCYYANNKLLSTSALKGVFFERLFDIHNIVFVVFFEFAFFAALIILLVKKVIPSRAWPSLLFLSVLSGTLISIGEIQPRYIYPIWFIAPIIIVACLDLWINKEEKKMVDKNCIFFIISEFLILIFLVCTFFSIIHIFAHFTDQRYLDMGAWREFTSNYAIENELDFFNSIQPATGQKHFRLALQHARAPKKGDKVLVKHSYIIKDTSPRSFKAYIHKPFQSRQDDKSALDPFIITMRVNGEKIDRLSLQGGEVSLIEAAHISPQNNKIQIEFAIEAISDTGTDFLPQDSLVFIEFAQLLKEAPRELHQAKLARSIWW